MQHTHSVFYSQMTTVMLLLLGIRCPPNQICLQCLLQVCPNLITFFHCESAAQQPVIQMLYKNPDS